jgi:hypothetical protein
LPMTVELTRSAHVELAGGDRCTIHACSERSFRIEIRERRVAP